MPGPARWTVYALVGLALTVLAVLSWLPGGVELRVEPVKGGPPLLVAPLRPGERFTLHYRHSVEGTPIWEEHSLDRRGRIFVEEERYVRFGAGMGYLQGRGRLTQRGEFEVIEDMHVLLGDFILRIGQPGVDHTIIWRGTRTDLSAVAPGAAVRVRGRPVSRLNLVWCRFFPHPAQPG